MNNEDVRKIKKYFFYRKSPVYSTDLQNPSKRNITDPGQ